MQRPYNDRWERTRRHLLRNLFDYQGDLSPIAEEPGSDSSDNRPYSPLPDLIVEREANRHDHTEEFYAALAVRMRRYYTRLFIDGVSEYEATFDDVDDVPEFELNKSMASTFIIDTNNHPDKERHTIEADESREEFESVIDDDESEVSTKKQSKFISREEKSDARNVTNDTEKRNGIEPSNINSTELDVESNEAETEFNDGVNKDQATSDKNASKSIESVSDLVDNCHRIFTTVVQVHDEVQQARAPRVFEDGSPILMPKAQKLSRSVFGRMSLEVRNIMSFANDEGNDEHQEKGKAAEIDGDDKTTQRVSKKIDDRNKPKTVAENFDLEVEWLVKSVDRISNETRELIETSEEEETFEDIEQKKNHETTSKELDAFDDKDCKTIEDDDESPLRTSESDEIIQIQNEESIGPNEFIRVELTPKASKEIREEEILDLNDNTFEMALKKGLFETKNSRINPVSSSDEYEDDSSEGFDPVEVMRGTMQTRLTETLRRESTMSKDSPLVRTVIQATAEEIEEDHFERDVSQSNAFDVVVSETRDESEHRSLEIDLTISQDSNSTGANGTDDVAEEQSFPDDLECINASVDKDNKSSDDVDTNTPSGAKIRSVADVCDDIWSVSPVNIDFRELPPKGYDVLISSCSTDLNQKKRTSDSDLDGDAPVNKKKRYNNIAIQTAASKESTSNWNSVKDNFFVGKPLMFKLCSCHDHVCL